MTHEANTQRIDQTHAQELEDKYYALYRQMAELKSYIALGGRDIEKILEYANEKI